MDAWIDAGMNEMDAELLFSAETITGKKHPDPLSSEGFVFILNEIEARDWTWTLCKMHENTTFTIYFNGEQSLVINKCLNRAVFLCYIDVLTDLNNRQLL
jgi:hypothetical protein